MKQKVFTLLVLLMTVLSASARLRDGYYLTFASGAQAHGYIFPTVDGSDTNYVAAGTTVTITVIPENGWEVAAVSGQTYMIGDEMKAPRRTADTDIDILGDVTITPDATDPHVFTFVMPAANVEVSASYQEVDATELALSPRVTSIEKRYFINEHSARGTVVAKLTVVDKNQQDGAFVNVDYSLIDNNRISQLGDIFDVKETANIRGVRTVEISVKDAEKLDNKDLWGWVNALLTMKAADGHFGTAETTIIVNNVNEAPVAGNQSFTLAEKDKDGSNWKAGTEVGWVVASDPDNTTLAYKVVTTGVPFAFLNGSSTLIVTDGSVLDYETKPVWTFTATASDGELSQEFTVTVNLTDVNEAPVIEDVKNVYSVNENTATGTSFGTFTVTNNDAGDKLTYTLTGELTGAAGISGTLKNKTLADIFYVDEPANSSGKRTASIRVKSSALLDYEDLYKASQKNATYPVTITVTDKADNSVSAETQIDIKDVNEDLSATGGTFYIQEHSPGLSHVSNTKNYQDCSESEYSYVTGKDDDKYNKSFSTLTYSISSANTDAQAADAANFFIDPNDGCIFTAATAEFEYDGDDAKRSYTFLVNVSDGVNSKDAEVTVEVLGIEEPPINMVTEGSGRIWEDATKGFLAATFSKDFITDEDELAKFNALGDDVRFTINDGASGYGVFEVDETTGDIYLNDPSKIDFETLGAKDASCRENGTNPIYEVKMTASNADGSKTLDITRNIEIVDVNEAPTASNLTKTVDENIAGGTVIGTIQASDPDRWANCNVGCHSCGFNELHYSIVDASGLPFEINQITGEIKLKRNERLRYSEKSQYQFDVKVSDRATSQPALSTTAHVTINVKDINEPSKFVTLNDVYEVNENVETGAELDGGNIVVLDDDQADVNSLTITITDNDATAALDAANLFEVVQKGNTDADRKSTFVIKTKADLDYEAIYMALKKAEFNVTLTITDKAGNTVSQETKIRVKDVNEEPQFAQESFAFSVNENTTRETSLDMAKAEDPDICTPQYGTLYFSLEGDDAASFMIDPATGEIFTVRGAKFDYETKDKYQFQAVVTDKNSTVRVPITVTVNNVAERPEFAEVNPMLIIEEGAQQGAYVGVVSAIDDDTTNDHAGKAPYYSLEATDDNADDYKAFSIDNDGGITVAADALKSFAEKSVYWVRVVVTDGNDPTLSTSNDVAINVCKNMDNLFVGSNLWTDYVAPENLLLPEGMTAYVVTAIDGTKASIEAIDYIPQLIPVLLKREDAELESFSAPKGFGETFTSNALLADDEDKEVKAGELYLLYNDEFVLTSSGTLPAGRAYLPATATATQAPRLSIGGDGMTGIRTMSDVRSKMSDVWYTLDGRKLVKAPVAKGLYIKNGKKLIVR